MPRRHRQAAGGLVYHVLNRGVGRMKLFEEDGDYEAFERVLKRTHEQLPTRVLAYCLMPNHWHLVLWPREDGELSEFMRLLTVTHTQRWHAYRKTAGTGPIYQGRFKSFPAQDDAHFLVLARYVERNAKRCNLVKRAETWRWSSLWAQRSRRAFLHELISDWPVNRPGNWLSRVNEPESDAELEALRKCIRRGSPFGSERWVEQTVKRLGLESSIRSRGRPRKQPDER